MQFLNFGKCEFRIYETNFVCGRVSEANGLAWTRLLQTFTVATIIKEITTVTHINGIFRDHNTEQNNLVWPSS